MKIHCLRINGIENPVGFQFSHISCSWKVTDTTAATQKSAHIEVSLEDSFLEPVYEIEGEELSSIGTQLDFEIKPRTRYFYRVTVVGDNGERAVSEPAYFETGKMDEAWEGIWIGLEADDDYHPVLSTVFTLEREAERVRLYICGLGLYEAFINGSKAGDDYLAPFLNDYKSSLQYQTYDVASSLKQGENSIEIMLGNGWYKGRFGFSGRDSIFGDRFTAIAELIVSYSDGTEEKIVTGTDWKYRGSDIEESDIYDGEVLNRLLWKGRVNALKPVVAVNIDTPLAARYSLPVTVKEELAVAEVIKTPAGETVLDMGQNFTGYIEFEADFPEGTAVLLEVGEVLQKGNFYRDNYRSAKSRFQYISDGRKETVRPRFTFFGFRYVRVTGWPGTLKPSMFRGKVVYSDLEQTGFIKTSDEKINRLFLNALWGQKSNFLDIPTDCPQRNERLGWTGDAQVFASTASFNMDTRAFYAKFLKDLRAEQLRSDGAVASYIPSLEGMAGSSVWGDAATIIPMVLYDHYGDRAALSETWPLMKDWVDYITREDNKRGAKYLFDFGFHFGDWLALDGASETSMKGGTEDAFIASAFYYSSARKVSIAAGVLGKTEEAVSYAKLADKIKEAVFAEYFTPNGRLAIDSQTGYFVALKFGLFPKREKIIEGLKTRLKKDCYYLTGGFVGATMMCSVLAEYGLGDLAYHFLFNEEFPGWLYAVNLGATTIWERWNSLLPDGTISGTGMNSLNHYSYGSVIEFIYRYVAGIQQLEPGFGKVRIAPVISNRLKSCTCRYESASGTIVSEWKIEKNGDLNIHIEIPFNVSATVVLPFSKENPFRVDSGSYDYIYTPNKDLLRIFSMDSTLVELKTNERAVEILREKLPQAAGIIAEGNREYLSMSLNELKHMFFLGFTPDLIDKAAEELLKILID